MLVDSLVLVHIFSTLGKQVSQRDLKLKWNSSWGGLRPALTAGFLYFQILSVPLASCHPEGFRECSGKDLGAAATSEAAVG